MNLLNEITVNYTFGISNRLSDKKIRKKNVSFVQFGFDFEIRIKTNANSTEDVFPVDFFSSHFPDNFKILSRWWSDKWNILRSFWVDYEIRFKLLKNKNLNPQLASRIQNTTKKNFICGNFSVSKAKCWNELISIQFRWAISNCCILIRQQKILKKRKKEKKLSYHHLNLNLKLNV